ncbi:hypothetical protein [Litoreibacter roseus]|uniref:Uncharacterized protein n=1 Tax=Litoreibacter roseus TaxID=2601869 RepID=A0A6N6JCV8_9RHOB|nr:hypothetical protein [Litoreibacter roseus]GFE63158.1 hypothetical protein KIN_02320 [Litoreibacter roseus]
MAIRMKQFTIHFDPETGGVRTGQTTVNFNENIKEANAVLKGFEARFTSPGSDRDIRQIHIDLDVTSVTQHAVNVKADFGLRDASGNFDDAYAGFVQGVVIAEH